MICLVEVCNDQHARFVTYQALRLLSNGTKNVRIGKQVTKIWLFKIREKSLDLDVFSKDKKCLYSYISRDL